MVFLLELLLLFFAALAIGILGNVAGIGGGVLLMLIFIFLLGIDPVVAGGLSLLTIISSTAFGSLINRGQGSIDKRLFLDIAVLSGTGAVIGSVLSYYIIVSSFKLFFGITVLGLGLFSFISARIEIRVNRDKDYLKRTFAESHESGLDRFRSHRSLALVSFIAGIISGTFGVGIGAVVGTFLTSIKHIHPKVAFSTLLASMIITSTVGAAVHFSEPGLAVNMMLLMMLLVPLLTGAALGGFTGAQLSNRMSFSSLRSSQSYIVMFFGALSIAMSLLRFH
ncbi:MAG: sulfite exporter TauE/SafE family protein [Nitrososphaerota archaeon]|nr:sulfite exporter TauE/SafE family protein [Nitrososphaerota archaeon]